MEDAEFNEIKGLTFGIRKSLIRFRKRVLEEEQQFPDKPTLYQGPGSAPVPLEHKANEVITIEQAAIHQEFENKIDVERTPGQWPGNEEESTDLFGTPIPKETAIYEEGVYEDSFSVPSFSIQKEITRNEESCTTGCRPSMPFDEKKEGTPSSRISGCRPSKEINKKKEGTPSSRVEYREESVPSQNSLCLSNKSLRKKPKLPNLKFISAVKWEEQGKQRSTKDFKKLRSEEIVLEGYLQKLAGSNSRFKINHWKTRYGILLKSGIFINFECHNKTLYQKGVADLTTVERIQIPQTTSGGASLRIEIFTSKKRWLLGFSTEAEMQMWRNEILAVETGGDNGKEEDEKSN